MKVTFIPIIIVALGTVNKGLMKGLEDLEIKGRVETIQTTTLLRTAKLLRRVLETRGDFLSFKHQYKTISQRWWVNFSKSNNNDEKRETTHDRTNRTTKSRKKSEHSEKRKPTNIWEYWRLTPSNKWRWKETIKKENLKRTRKLHEKKLYSMNLIKGKNTRAVPLQDTRDHSGSEPENLNKWTR